MCYPANSSKGRENESERERGSSVEHAYEECGRKAFFVNSNTKVVILKNVSFDFEMIVTYDDA